ncbi:myozenin-1 isoform x2 [Limosa lapponica baueri]|uniref:Myozenin-1 isoform x2 n=1 Tax=Limosa lapponica baueri TaxID=1758121 RepID=A0A2I0TQ59_LIMLA|nr:myozenin-1 isoform x2 [Limosa lapponica baueri]
MPQEVSKLNLGKKISIPRDVMLEELSLLTNKGSKMFKLRQLRVEKFIYENNPDAFTDNSVDHFQKFIPPGGHYGEDAHGYAQGRMVGGVTAGQHGSKQQYPGGPPQPGSKGGPGFESLMIYNQNFRNRPSFNRTPIPWMPSGDSSEYHTEINVPRNGETEEL